MRAKMAALTAAVLLATSTAFALDGSVSAEVDRTRTGYTSTDTNFNLGVVAGKYRHYVNAEVIVGDYKPTIYGHFGMSDLDLRYGTEINTFDSFKFEAGTGIYLLSDSLNAHGVPYMFGKATWTFDTNPK